MWICCVRVWCGGCGGVVAVWWMCGGGGGVVEMVREEESAEKGRREPRVKSVF